MGFLYGILYFFFFLRLTGWVRDRLGNHGFLVRHLVFLLLPAQIIKLIVALLSRRSFVLDSPTLVKTSPKSCSLLFHCELGSVAHIAGRPPRPVDIAALATLPVVS